MDMEDTTSPTVPVSRRPTRVERVRRIGDLSVNQLSLQELQQELQRRVKNLQEQKQELLDKIDEINRELDAIGTMGGVESPGETNGREPGRRPRNAVPLADLLASVLMEKPLSTREASEAALEAGYRTTSRNFVNSVGVALHRDERFVKQDGKWTVAERSES